MDSLGDIVMISLSDISPNPNNPRTITKTKFDKLKKSLTDFGKMMELRPIVVNADGMILGGNQRYNALVALGYAEIPDTWVRRADDLTPEEQHWFIIEDNLPFGAWDFDALANQFEFDDLIEWGFEEGELIGFSAPEFKEYDETVANDVEMTTCPKCGHVFPK